MFCRSAQVVKIINGLLSENECQLKNQPALKTLNGSQFKNLISSLNLASEQPQLFQKIDFQVLYHVDIIEHLLDGDLDLIRTHIDLQKDLLDQTPNKTDQQEEENQSDHLKVYPNQIQNFRTPIPLEFQSEEESEPLMELNTPNPSSPSYPYHPLHHSVLEIENQNQQMQSQGLSEKLKRKTDGLMIADQKFALELPSDYSVLSKQKAIEMIRLGKTLEKVGIHTLELSEEFTKNINLIRVHIKKLVIKKCVFHKLMVLNLCKIDSLEIQDSKFTMTFSLKGSSVRYFTLTRSEFLQGLNAEKASFERQILWNQLIFHQRLRFWECTFQDWISWSDCKFLSDVDLRSTYCEYGFSAKKCEFLGDVKFRGMHLAMKWEAPESRFEGLIDFSKAKLHDFVYLEEIIQGEHQRWAFMNTISERILISPKQVEGRLLSEEEGNYVQAMREYGILKKAFEHEHRYDDDDWAFYRFKVNERKAENHQRSFIEKPMGAIKDILDWLFLDWGCGYGTSPLRAVRSALVMILLFALLYTTFFYKIHPIDNLPFPNHARDHIFNQFGVSVLLSVAAFTSGVGDLKESVADWMNIPLMLEALLGTLMWGLFIVAFGRKVIR
jgi:hypothetical protein